MSVIDEYHKLKSQLEAMGTKAKDEALVMIHAAIETLSHLGHEYHLVEGRKPSVEKANGGVVISSGRRTGIRDEVLGVVKKHGPASRAEVIERMDARGDKSASQSISNALAALKKAGTVTLDGGQYSTK